MAQHYGPTSIVSDSLVLCYDAADTFSYPGSGTTWTDLSGNGLNGTLTNGPTFSDGNIDFDGSNDYINFGDVSAYEWAYNSTYTLCAWFYLDADQNGMIMSKAESSSNYRGWYLYFKASDNTLTHALLNDTSPSRRWGQVTDSGIATGTWYYVCATYNGGDDTGKFYLNGTEVDSTRNYNTLSTWTTATSVPFSIGMRNTTSYPFNGKIPIVGVGGVNSGKSAYEKIIAGASLLQLYTSFIYRGPSAAKDIKKELIQILKAEGIKNIKEAIGKDI